MKISSNQVAGGLLFLLDHGLHFGLHDDPHRLVENVFEPVLSERAALHVLALELLLDDLSGSFLHNRGFLRVFLHCGVFVPQVDFVSDKNFRHVTDVFLQLGIPLQLVEKLLSCGH